MKQILTLIATLFIICSCSIDSSDTDLLRAIKNSLPENWTVELSDSLLVVNRRAPIIGIKVVASMDMDVEYTPIQYSFRFLKTSFLTAEEYQNIRSRNKDYKTEAEQLYRNAKIADIPRCSVKSPRWQQDYEPRNESESKAVKKYKQLYSQINKLPDLYINQNAFYYVAPRYRFQSEPEKAECDSVLDQVLNVFSKYDEDFSKYPWETNEKRLLNLIEARNNNTK